MNIFFNLIILLLMFFAVFNHICDFILREVCCEISDFSILSLCYYNFGAASPALRAAGIKTRAFDVRRLLDNNLINKLPLVQREILFSLLKDRTIILGSSESKRREAVVRGSETLPPDQSENRLMAAVATREGYEQRLAESRSFLRNGYEEAVFGLMNYWKVNLGEVMPHTAALTYKDFIVSAERRGMEGSAVAVLNLVAMGHENIVKIFKSFSYPQLRDVLFATHKRWQLKDGEAALVQKFSKDQRFYTEYLQERKADHSTSKSDVDSIARRVEQMEKIAAIEVESDKADAVASFYAQQALDDYVVHTLLHSAKAEFAEQYRPHDANRVATAAIADLGIDGYIGLRELSKFGNSSEKFYDSLAEELDSQRGNWLRSIFLGVNAGHQ